MLVEVPTSGDMVSASCDAASHAFSEAFNSGKLSAPAFSKSTCEPMRVILLATCPHIHWVCTIGIIEMLMPKSVGKGAEKISE